MYEQAKDSLGRCLNHGDLFKRFYEIFVLQHPAIAALVSSVVYVEGYDGAY